MNERVNFFVWLLQRDGLHVPPFVHHGGGDRRLRAAGMTPDAWRRWLRSYVAIVEDAEELRDDPGDALFGHIHDPLRAWQGAGGVFGLLPMLWADYVQDAGKWANYEQPGMGQHLWEQVQLWAPRLGALHEYQVSYPVAAAYALPPASGLVAPGPVWDQRGYETALRTLVLELSAQSASDER